MIINFGTFFISYFIWSWIKLISYSTSHLGKSLWSLRTSSAALGSKIFWQQEFLLNFYHNRLWSCWDSQGLPDSVLSEKRDLDSIEEVWDLCGIGYGPYLWTLPIGYAFIEYFKCVFWRLLGTADLNQLSPMKFIVKVNTKCKLDKSFRTRFSYQPVRKVLSSAIFHYQRLSLDTLIQTSKYRNRWFYDFLRQIYVYLAICIDFWTIYDPNLIRHFQSFRQIMKYSTIRH